MTRHLLVAGAQRCGTTYLHHLLDAHPQITMARPARPEPKVFLSEESTRRGRAWYRATFFAHARDEAVLGDKSTSYLEDPGAAVRARSMLGEAVVLVSLRDPVQRAVSNWRFSTDNGLERRPLDQALEENLEGAASWDGSGSSVSPFAYLERGRYAAYLEPWRQAFPDDLQVLFLHDLVNDPAAVPHLYESLGVDPSFQPGGRRAVNESLEPATPLPEDLVGRLRDYFAASDAALMRMVGRDLPWPTHAERKLATGG